MGAWLAGSMRTYPCRMRAHLLTTFTDVQMSAEQSRSLKIKANAVKRTTKEYLYYFKEKDQEEAKLQKMRDNGGDPYDIKQQENVVQESTVMIPATKKSLESQLADLKGFLTELGVAYDSAGTEKEETDQILAAAKEALSKGG